MKWPVVLYAVAFALYGPAYALETHPPLWKTMPVVRPLPRPDRSGLARVNGIGLYYAIFNTSGSDPVILLHGGLGSSDQWGDEVPRLAASRRVIVVDSRGHGRSMLGSHDLSYALMASDVVRLMDFLKVRKASIVGSSDGGIIGLLIAIHYPDRIDKLLAFGANFNNADEPPAPPDRAAFARYASRAEAAYRKRSPTPNGFPILLAALRKLYRAEPDIRPAELATIRARTVIADGAYEQFISRKHTQTLARLIPGARLVIIPNVSHGGPMQDPVAFHRAVAGLLDGDR